MALDNTEQKEQISCKNYTDCPPRMVCIRRNCVSIDDIIDIGDDGHYKQSIPSGNINITNTNTEHYFTDSTGRKHYRTPTQNVQEFSTQPHDPYAHMQILFEGGNGCGNLGFKKGKTKLDDKNVSVQDLIKTIRSNGLVVDGSGAYDTCTKWASDMNDDGRVTLEDAVTVLNVVTSYQVVGCTNPNATNYYCKEPLTQVRCDQDPMDIPNFNGWNNYSRSTVPDFVSSDDRSTCRFLDEGMGGKNYMGCPVESYCVDEPWCFTVIDNQYINNNYGCFNEMLIDTGEVDELSQTVYETVNVPTSCVSCNYDNYEDGETLNCPDEDCSTDYTCCDTYYPSAKSQTNLAPPWHTAFRNKYGSTGVLDNSDWQAHFNVQISIHDDHWNSWGEEGEFQGYKGNGESLTHTGNSWDNSPSYCCDSSQVEDKSECEFKSEHFPNYPGDGESLWMALNRHDCKEIGHYWISNSPYDIAVIAVFYDAPGDENPLDQFGCTGTYYIDDNESNGINPDYCNNIVGITPDFRSEIWDIFGYDTNPLGNGLPASSVWPYDATPPLAFQTAIASDNWQLTWDNYPAADDEFTWYEDDRNSYYPYIPEVPPPNGHPVYSFDVALNDSGGDLLRIKIWDPKEGDIIDAGCWFASSGAYYRNKNLINDPALIEVTRYTPTTDIGPPSCAYPFKYIDLGGNFDQKYFPTCNYNQCALYDCAGLPLPYNEEERGDDSCCEYVPCLDENNFPDESEDYGGMYYDWWGNSGEGANNQYGYECGVLEEHITSYPFLWKYYQDTDGDGLGCDVGGQPMSLLCFHQSSQISDLDFDANGTTYPAVTNGICHDSSGNPTLTICDFDSDLSNSYCENNHDEGSTCVSIGVDIACDCPYGIQDSCGVCNGTASGDGNYFWGGTQCNFEIGDPCGDGLEECPVGWNCENGRCNDQNNSYDCTCTCGGISFVDMCGVCMSDDISSTIAFTCYKDLDGDGESYIGADTQQCCPTPYLHDQNGILIQTTEHSVTGCSGGDTNDNECPDGWTTNQPSLPLCVVVNTCGNSSINDNYGKQAIISNDCPTPQDPCSNQSECYIYECEDDTCQSNNYDVCGNCLDMGDSGNDCLVNECGPYQGSCVSYINDVYKFDECFIEDINEGDSCHQLNCSATDNNYGYAADRCYECNPGSYIGNSSWNSSCSDCNGAPCVTGFQEWYNDGTDYNQNELFGGYFKTGCVNRIDYTGNDTIYGSCCPATELAANDCQICPGRFSNDEIHDYEWDASELPYRWFPNCDGDGLGYGSAIDYCGRTNQDLGEYPDGCPDTNLDCNIYLIQPGAPPMDDHTCPEGSNCFATGNCWIDTCENCIDENGHSVDCYGTIPTYQTVDGVDLQSRTTRSTITCIDDAEYQDCYTNYHDSCEQCCNSSYCTDSALGIIEGGYECSGTGSYCSPINQCQGNEICILPSCGWYQCEAAGIEPMEGRCWEAGTGVTLSNGSPGPNYHICQELIDNWENTPHEERLCECYDQGCGCNDPFQSELQYYWDLDGDGYHGISGFYFCPPPPGWEDGTTWEGGPPNYESGQWSSSLSDSDDHLACLNPIYDNYFCCEFPQYCQINNLISCPTDQCNQCEFKYDYEIGNGLTVVLNPGEYDGVVKPESGVTGTELCQEVGASCTHMMVYNASNSDYIHLGYSCNDILEPMGAWTLGGGVFTTPVKACCGADCSTETGTFRWIFCGAHPTTEDFEYIINEECSQPDSGGTAVINNENTFQDYFLEAGWPHRKDNECINLDGIMLDADSNMLSNQEYPTYYNIVTTSASGTGIIKIRLDMNVPPNVSWNASHPAYYGNEVLIKIQNSSCIDYSEYSITGDIDSIVEFNQVEPVPNDPSLCTGDWIISGYYPSNCLDPNGPSCVGKFQKTINISGPVYGCTTLPNQDNPICNYNPSATHDTYAAGCLNQGSSCIEARKYYPDNDCDGNPCCNYEVHLCPDLEDIQEELINCSVNYNDDGTCDGINGNNCIYHNIVNTGYPYHTNLSPYEQISTLGPITHDDPILADMYGEFNPTGIDPNTPICFNTETAVKYCYEMGNRKPNNTDYDTSPGFVDCAYFLGEPDQWELRNLNTYTTIVCDDCKKRQKISYYDPSGTVVGTNCETSGSACNCVYNIFDDCGECQQPVCIPVEDCDTGMENPNIACNGTSLINNPCEEGEVPSNPVWNRYCSVCDDPSSVNYYDDLVTTMPCSGYTHTCEGECSIALNGGTKLKCSSNTDCLGIYGECEFTYPSNDGMAELSFVNPTLEDLNVGNDSEGNFLLNGETGWEGFSDGIEAGCTTVSQIKILSGANDVDNDTLSSFCQIWGFDGSTYDYTCTPDPNSLNIVSYVWSINYEAKTIECITDEVLGTCYYLDPYNYSITCMDDIYESGNQGSNCCCKYNYGCTDPLSPGYNQGCPEEGGCSRDCNMTPLSDCLFPYESVQAETIYTLHTGIGSDPSSDNIIYLKTQHHNYSHSNLINKYIRVNNEIMLITDMLNWTIMNFSYDFDDWDLEISWDTVIQFSVERNLFNTGSDTHSTNTPVVISIDNCVKDCCVAYEVSACTDTSAKNYYCNLSGEIDNTGNYDNILCRDGQLPEEFSDNPYNGHIKVKSCEPNDGSNPDTCGSGKFLPSSGNILDSITHNISYPKQDGSEWQQHDADRAIASTWQGFPVGTQVSCDDDEICLPHFGLGWNSNYGLDPNINWNYTGWGSNMNSRFNQTWSVSVVTRTDIPIRGINKALKFHIPYHEDNLSCEWGDSCAWGGLFTWHPDLATANFYDAWVKVISGKVQIGQLNHPGANYIESGPTNNQWVHIHTMVNQDGIGIYTSDPINNNDESSMWIYANAQDSGEAEFYIASVGAYESFDDVSNYNGNSEFENCCCEYEFDCSGNRIEYEYVESPYPNLSYNSLYVSTYDDCGVCSEGQSGHIPDTDSKGCGCFKGWAPTWYYDYDCPNVLSDGSCGDEGVPDGHGCLDVKLYHPSFYDQNGALYGAIEVDEITGEVTGYPEDFSYPVNIWSHCLPEQGGSEPHGYIHPTTFEGEGWNGIGWLGYETDPAHCKCSHNNYDCNENCIDEDSVGIFFTDCVGVGINNSGCDDCQMCYGPNRDLSQCTNDPDCNENMIWTSPVSNETCNWTPDRDKFYVVGLASSTSGGGDYTQQQWESHVSNGYEIYEGNFDCNCECFSEESDEDEKSYINDCGYCVGGGTGREVNYGKDNCGACLWESIVDSNYGLNSKCTGCLDQDACNLNSNNVYNGGNCQVYDWTLGEWVDSDCINSNSDQCTYPAGEFCDCDGAIISDFDVCDSEAPFSTGQYCNCDGYCYDECGECGGTGAQFECTVGIGGEPIGTVCDPEDCEENFTAWIQSSKRTAANCAQACSQGEILNTSTGETLMHDAGYSVVDASNANQTDQLQCQYITHWLRDKWDRVPDYVEKFFDDDGNPTGIETRSHYCRSRGWEVNADGGPVDNHEIPCEPPEEGIGYYESEDCPDESPICGGHAFSTCRTMCSTCTDSLDNSGYCSAPCPELLAIAAITTGLCDVYVQGVVAFVTAGAGSVPLGTACAASMIALAAAIGVCIAKSVHCSQYGCVSTIYGDHTCDKPACELDWLCNADHMFVPSCTTDQTCLDDCINLLMVDENTHNYGNVYLDSGGTSWSTGSGTDYITVDDELMWCCCTAAAVRYGCTDQYADNYDASASINCIDPSSQDDCEVCNYHVGSGCESWCSWEFVYPNDANPGVDYVPCVGIMDCNKNCFTDEWCNYHWQTDYGCLQGWNPENEFTNVTGDNFCDNGGFALVDFNCRATKYDFGDCPCRTAPYFLAGDDGKPVSEQVDPDCEFQPYNITSANGTWQVVYESNEYVSNSGNLSPIGSEGCEPYHTSLDNTSVQDGVCHYSSHEYYSETHDKTFRGCMAYNVPEIETCGTGGAGYCGDGNNFDINVVQDLPGGICGRNLENGREDPNPNWNSDPTGQHGSEDLCEDNDVFGYACNKDPHCYWTERINRDWNYVGDSDMNMHVYFRCLPHTGADHNEDECADPDYPTAGYGKGRWIPNSYQSTNRSSFPVSSWPNGTGELESGNFYVIFGKGEAAFPSYMDGSGWCFRKHTSSGYNHQIGNQNRWVHPWYYIQTGETQGPIVQGGNFINSIDPYYYDPNEIGTCDSFEEVQGIAFGFNYETSQMEEVTLSYTSGAYLNINEFGYDKATCLGELTGMIGPHLKDCTSVYCNNFGSGGDVCYYSNGEPSTTGCTYGQAYADSTCSMNLCSGNADCGAYCVQGGGWPGEWGPYYGNCSQENSCNHYYGWNSYFKRRSGYKCSPNIWAGGDCQVSIFENMGLWYHPFLVDYSEEAMMSSNNDDASVESNINGNDNITTGRKPAMKRIGLSKRDVIKNVSIEREK